MSLETHFRANRSSTAAQQSLPHVNALRLSLFWRDRERSSCFLLFLLFLFQIDVIHGEGLDEDDV